MKRTIACLALTALLAPFAAYADGANSQASSDGQYHYGMPLDVAKVVSMTPASDIKNCQVGTAHMVYIDHQGKTHEVDYREMGDCLQQ